MQVWCLDGSLMQSGRLKEDQILNPGSVLMLLSVLISRADASAQEQGWQQYSCS